MQNVSAWFGLLTTDYKLTLLVRHDSAVGDGFGQRVDSSLQQPTEEDSSAVNVVLLGDGSDDLIVAKVVSVGTAKRGIRLRKNLVLLEPFDQLELWALKGQLDLV